MTEPTSTNESLFFKEATLMLEMISFVAEEKCFALKGGTAINFFVRDMPRLSVDIDLTYLLFEEREISLKGISSALNRIASKIKKSRSDLKIQFGLMSGTKHILKLHVIGKEAQIKIEPNQIMRGHIFPTREMNISQKVEALFGVATSITVVSSAELYGGKICAALDRQHPRDLFDIKVLFENEGLTDEIRLGFIIALASHNRTMGELLEPTKKNITAVFKNQFIGMTTVPVSLNELLTAREHLVSSLKSTLSNTEKQFLLSVKKAKPEWGLLDLEGVERLPAIQWKIANTKKMKPELHLDLVERLTTVLGL